MSITPSPGLIVPCLLKKKYKCIWFYLTDLTDNLETIHVQVWESFIVESVSSRICCSYKFFLSQVIFIFPLFQLHYTIPKNKRKTEITWDKKLTTTYKSNGKREFLPRLFIQENCFELFLSGHFLSWEILNLSLTFADYVTGKIWFQVKFFNLQARYIDSQFP